MCRAVFLDRDGVINRAIVRDGRPYPPANLAEVEVLPGVSDALRVLHAKGFMLIVVTNQPDVARGTKQKETIEEINAFLGAELKIDEFRVCYHDDKDRCDCRKPKAGALIAASRKHGIDLGESYMVGDRWKDIEAGHKAGCKTIFIDYRYQEKQPKSPDYRCSSLTEATNIILTQSNGKNKET
jgi:D-glycero-D-manno-heptose 1,7-bisphosphate phosphatase